MFRKDPIGKFELNSSWQLDDDLTHGNETLKEYLISASGIYREMYEYIPGSEDEENFDLFPWILKNI